MLLPSAGGLVVTGEKGVTDAEREEPMQRYEHKIEEDQAQCAKATYARLFSTRLEQTAVTAAHPDILPAAKDTQQLLRRCKKTDSLATCTGGVSSDKDKPSGGWFSSPSAAKGHVDFHDALANQVSPTLFVTVRTHYAPREVSRWEKMMGPVLIRKDEHGVQHSLPTDVVLGLRARKIHTLIFYFGFQKCPCCRKLGPKVVEWYNNKEKNLPGTEIIFVSFDKTQALSEEYYGHIPWPRLPFHESWSKRGKTMRAEGGTCPKCPKVTRYPTLLVVDARTAEFKAKFVGDGTTLVNLQDQLPDGALEDGNIVEEGLEYQEMGEEDFVEEMALKIHGKKSSASGAGKETPKNEEAVEAKVAEKKDVVRVKLLTLASPSSGVRTDSSSGATDVVPWGALLPRNEFRVTTEHSAWLPRTSFFLDNAGGTSSVSPLQRVINWSSQSLFGTSRLDEIECLLHFQDGTVNFCTTTAKASGSGWVSHLFGGGGSAVDFANVVRVSLRAFSLVSSTKSGGHGGHPAKYANFRLHPFAEGTSKGIGSGLIGRRSLAARQATRTVEQTARLCRAAFGLLPEHKEAVPGDAKASKMMYSPSTDLVATAGDASLLDATASLPAVQIVVAAQGKLLSAVETRHSCAKPKDRLDDCGHEVFQAIEGGPGISSASSDHERLMSYRTAVSSDLVCDMKYDDRSAFGIDDLLHLQGLPVEILAPLEKQQDRQGTIVGTEKTTKNVEGRVLRQVSFPALRISRALVEGSYFDLQAHWLAHVQGLWGALPVAGDAGPIKPRVDMASLQSLQQQLRQAGTTSTDAGADGWQDTVKKVIALQKEGKTGNKGAHHHDQKIVLPIVVRVYESHAAHGGQSGILDQGGIHVAIQRRHLQLEGSLRTSSEDSAAVAKADALFRLRSWSLPSFSQGGGGPHGLLDFPLAHGKLEVGAQLHLSTTQIGYLSSGRFAVHLLAKKQEDRVASSSISQSQLSSSSLLSSDAVYTCWPGRVQIPLLQYRSVEAGDLDECLAVLDAENARGDGEAGTSMQIVYHATSDIYHGKVDEDDAKSTTNTAFGTTTTSTVSNSQMKVLSPSDFIAGKQSTSSSSKSETGRTTTAQQFFPMVTLQHHGRLVPAYLDIQVTTAAGSTAGATTWTVPSHLLLQMWSLEDFRLQVMMRHVLPMRSAAHQGGSSRVPATDSLLNAGQDVLEKGLQIGLRQKNGGGDFVGGSLLSDASWYETVRAVADRTTLQLLAAGALAPDDVTTVEGMKSSAKTTAEAGKYASLELAVIADVNVLLQPLPSEHHAERSSSSSSAHHQTAVHTSHTKPAHAAVVRPHNAGESEPEELQPAQPATEVSPGANKAERPCSTTEVLCASIFFGLLAYLVTRLILAALARLRDRNKARENNQTWPLESPLSDNKNRNLSANYTPAKSLGFYGYSEDRPNDRDDWRSSFTGFGGWLTEGEDPEDDASERARLL
ncbi:unnamed protein product [Amoebophrya sp. A25]|nr:unnamed protein product [Amoebophrya sp. A25]|eukprot:GSA25T00026890001.1